MTRNYITYSDNYGEQYQKFNGVDINVSARPRSGLTAQGGVSFGKAVGDNCEIRDKVPEISRSVRLNPYCHVETTMLPQYKALSSYIIPKVDVQVSATFTSKPGVNLSGFGTPQQGGAFQANYVMSNAALLPILGRPLAGNAPNLTVNIIAPYEQVGERINELDLRFQKILDVREDAGELRRGHLQRAELRAGAQL